MSFFNISIKDSILSSVLSDEDKHAVKPSWGVDDYKGHGTHMAGGAAYGDLDNDGDLEIILNNIDDKAVIFENNNIEENNYLTIQFNGDKLNPKGIGAKCTINSNEKKQFQELSLEHGYISSMAPLLHFGLGKEPKIDTLKVEWADGKIQELTNLSVNEKITINYEEAIISNEVKISFFISHSRSSVLKQMLVQFLELAKMCTLLVKHIYGGQRGIPKTFSFSHLEYLTNICLDKRPANSYKIHIPYMH